MNPIHTGRFIRIQRKNLNLSQSKLAEMLGVEPQTVSKWERGLGMPDYDNVNRLREIFGCTLSEILEPSFDDGEEIRDIAPAEEKQTLTNLPILYEIINEKSGNERIEDKNGKTRRKSDFGVFDFLKKSKIQLLLEKMFGYEYANTYKGKFLFKDLFKKRKREEYETTLTQGMFKNKISHNVIGIEAPWLYMRVLLFMLVCLGITLALAFIGSPMPFIIVGSLLSALPLLVFLFESNFSRNLSIIDVLKMFAIGGLCSILITLLSSFGYWFWYDYPIVITAFLAPLVEELSKATLVVIFVIKYKPTNMLTGLLIGFSVGAGFSFFENIDYGLGSLLYDGSIGSILTIIIRTFGDFFMGHHYWTGIFGAIYVLFKKKTTFNLFDLLQWRVLLALLFSMTLHAVWNASGFITIPFLWIFPELLVAILSVSSLIILINVGISQTRIMGIWEDYQSEHGDEKKDSKMQEEEYASV